jgi:hypothetical protein
VKVDRGAALVLALSVFAWAPLLADGYFLRAHDAAHSLVFVVAFDQALRDGAFPPRWATDFALGYGYPLFVVYNPLSAALAEVFNLLGIGVVGGVKMVYALSLAGSGLAMYLFARALWGQAAGVLAGVLYIYLPYHLADVYVRSAAAETLSLVFPPLVLWASYRLAHPRAPRPLYALCGGLAYAALIFAHNGTAVIFTAVFAAWCGYLLVRSSEFGVRSSTPRPVGAPALAALAPRGDGAGRAAACPCGMPVGAGPGEFRTPNSELRTLAGLAGLGAVAVAVSAAFWLPLVTELRYLKAEQWTAYPFPEHFVYPFQFLSPYWGYGFSGPGTRDEIGFQVGVVAVFLGVFALRRLWRGPGRGEVAFFAAVTLVLLLAMTPLARPFWAASLGSLLQFPWRLLALVTLTAAALGGAALGGLADRLGPLWERVDARPAALLPLLLLAVVASQAYALPQFTPVAPEQVAPRAVVDFETTWADRTGLTIWVEEAPRTSPLVAQYQNNLPLQKVVAEDPEATVEMRHHGGHSDVARVRAPRPTRVTFLTYDFPGWTTYLDGKPVPHERVTSHALIGLAVPAGEHEVSARFERTPPRVIGEVVSALALAGCVAGFGWLWWRARRGSAAVDVVRR